MSGNPHRLAGCPSLHFPNTAFPSPRAVMLQLRDSLLLLISLQLAERLEILVINHYHRYLNILALSPSSRLCDGVVMQRTHLGGISWNGPLNHSGDDFLECVQSSALTSQLPGAWLWEEYTSPASQCQAAEGTPGRCVLGSTRGC